MATRKVPITFRILEAEDTEAYRQLRLLSFREAPLAFSESYEDERKRSLASFSEELKVTGTPPESFVLGAFDTQAKLVGFVKFRRDQRSKARHKSMIHAMYVDPAFRGYDIGRMIIEQIINRAREMTGLEQIHLWVLHAEGKSAAHFYKKCGFVGQGPLVKKDLKFKDTYIDAEYMLMYL